MLIFGGVGIVFDKLKFPLPPVVLGLILGGFAEENLRLSLTIGRGDWAILMRSMTSFVLICITLVIVLTPLIKKLRRKSAA